MTYRGDHSPTARFVALKVLSSIDDISFDDRLSRELDRTNLSSVDRSLVTELVFGISRWRGRLDYYLRYWFQGDFRRADSSLKYILRMGLYQLLYLDRIPDHAAVDTSVELAKKRLGENPARLVNAILRRAIREKETLPEPDARNKLDRLAITTSHPSWLVKRWVSRFGWSGAEAFCNANNQTPGLWIRWNPLKTDLDSFRSLLQDQGIDTTTSPLSPDHLLLKERVNTSNWQPLMDGLCTVQDISAGLPVQLLDPQPSEHILDFCAAPGGKTTQIAEAMGDTGVVLAQDVHPIRIQKVQQHIKRMGLKSICCLTGDGNNLKPQSFDRILLDVPCTGLGVIRRRPDIRWNRKEDDIHYMASIQRSILDIAVKLVKSDGVIVYSTCTTEPEENQLLIDHFLNDHSEWKRDKAESWIHQDVVNPRGEIETIPYIHNIDGSYAARIIRK